MALTAAQRETLKQELKKAQIAFAEQPWENFLQTIRIDNSFMVFPNSVIQTQQLMVIIKNVTAQFPAEDMITVRGVAGNTQTQIPHSTYSWFYSLITPPQPPKYDKSCSLEPIAVADVMVCFPKTNQTISVDTETQTVSIPAGTFIGEIEDVLFEYDLALPTVSMTARVTAEGLIGSAGHGTGKDQPAFAGLVQSIKAVNHEGNLITITKTNKSIEKFDGSIEIDQAFSDFEHLRAHLGLLGLIVEVTLKCVKKNNMQETLRTYENVSALSHDLESLLLNNPYTTLMIMPPFDSGHHAIQVRNWEPTNAPVTDPSQKPAYQTGTPEQRKQEIEIRLFGALLNHVIDHPRLLHAFLKLAQAIEIGHHETPFVHVGEQRVITHYQQAFPEGQLFEVSLLIPVANELAAETLMTILSKAQARLIDYQNQDIFPITYALYVRYFKGSPGGLSTSQTDINERTLAFEMVSHPNAPEFMRFKDEMIHFIQEELKLTVRYHLGKYFPRDKTFVDIYGEDQVKLFKSALARYYDHLEPEKNPFITPFFSEKLEYISKIFMELEQADELNPNILPAPETLPENIQAFQDHITSRFEALSPQQRESSQDLLKVLCEECQNVIKDIVNNYTKGSSKQREMKIF